MVNVLTLGNDQMKTIVVVLPLAALVIDQMAHAIGLAAIDLRRADDSVVRQQANDQVVVLDRSLCAVPVALVEHFPDTTELVRIRRLRSDSGVTLSYAENFLRPELAARFGDDQLRRVPMTQILRDELGLRLTRIENAIEARNATPLLAELLEVDLLSPILLSTNLTRDDTGAVVDAALIHYRGDRFRFTVDIDVR